MQRDRSSGYGVPPLIDVEPAMSSGDEKGNGFHEHHGEIVKDAIAESAAPQEHATDLQPAGVEPTPCHDVAGKG
jgi:hypothetical protein